MSFLTYIPYELIINLYFLYTFSVYLFWLAYRNFFNKCIQQCGRQFLNSGIIFDHPGKLLDIILFPAAFLALLFHFPDCLFQ